jgi:DNA invertase Pin-like site-specific DNA recombinase
MAAKPITMEQLKRVLTLYNEGQSIKGIVRLTGLFRNTVRSYLTRITEDVNNAFKQTDPVYHPLNFWTKWGSDLRQYRLIYSFIM